MPLQWLPLQQRQKQTGQPLRSPISEALTPRRTAGVTMGATPSGKGFMEKAEERQALEDERKFQEKMMKLQHEQGMEKMKFAANIEEDAKKGMTAGQVLGQQPTAEPAPALTKENMPEAAMQVWEFISTLEPESQKFFIQQLKQKEEPAGYIEAAGKRVEVPGSVGMYRYLVDQGLLDPATDTVIEKERLFEKGTFTITEEGGKVYQLNTATGERKQLGTVDEPEGVVNAINKQANSDALALAKTGEGISFEDAKHDALIDYGIDEEIAADMAKVKGIPKDPNKIPWYTNAINWIKSRGAKPTTKEDWEKAAGAGKVAFNEANVTSLVPVISDDVTDAERAHLKGQGASDVDIDEAIRRKGIK